MVRVRGEERGTDAQDRDRVLVAVRARAILERGIEDPALKPRAMTMLTLLSNRIEDYADGIRYGKQAVKLSPDSAEAHLQYAVALRWQAVEFLQAYLKTLPPGAEGMPGKESAYWRMGNAYEQLGRTDEARESLKSLGKKR